MFQREGLHTGDCVQLEELRCSPALTSAGHAPCLGLEGQGGAALLSLGAGRWQGN